MSDVTRVIRDFVLKEFLPGEPPEMLEDDTQLLETGILDSIATLRLASFLESEFSLKIEAHEMNPDNLGSLHSIAAFVDRKREGN